MKRIKNLNVGKTITAFLLAGAMSFTFAACRKTADMKSISPSELLSITDVKDLTVLDELMDEGRVMYNDELNIVQAATKLERHLNILEKLDSVDFKDVEALQELSDAEYQSVYSLSDEEIQELIKQANYRGNELLPFQEKIVALRKLNFLKQYCTEWVNQNGKEISVDFMIHAVKSAVADEFEIPTDEYYQITIPANDGKINCYCVQVGDEKYEVPSWEHELWDTINYIYEVQISDLTEDTAFDTFRKSLNFGKVTIAAGANEKKGKLSAQYSNSMIEKNYIKK